MAAAAPDEIMLRMRRDGRIGWRWRITANDGRGGLREIASGTSWTRYGAKRKARRAYHQTTGASLRLRDA